MELVRQLREYGARWPAEAETVRRFIEFLATHPDAFARSLACGHVTGSAWLVDRAGARVLLTHHKKLGIWVQLGGHADGDADAFRVARREAEEALKNAKSEIDMARATSELAILAAQVAALRKYRDKR